MSGEKSFYSWPQEAKEDRGERAQRGPRSSSLSSLKQFHRSEQKISKEHLANSGLSYDSKGRLWLRQKEDEEDVLLRVGESGKSQFSSYELRRTFSFYRNVEGFIDHHSRDRCLFFTLTDSEGIHPKEFGRRWNSWLTHRGSWIKSFCRVLEPTEKKRPHYHFLVSVDFDTMPDSFDWDAFSASCDEFKANGRSKLHRELTARYSSSASPRLRELWKMLRESFPGYSLGRSELLPLRKGKEQIASYVGKYLQAGMMVKVLGWKGCRVVEYSRCDSFTWRRCYPVFAWNSEQAKAYRLRLKEFAAVFGFTSFSELKIRLGPRWSWRFRDVLLDSSGRGLVDFKKFYLRKKL